MEADVATFQQNLFDSLTGPFLYPIMGMQRIYWLYLLTSLLLAFAVYIGRKKRSDEKLSLRKFFAFVFPKSIYFHQSAITDYKYFFVNKIVFAIFIAPALLGVDAVGTFVQQMGNLSFGAYPEHREAGIWLIVVYTLGVAMALDFAIFFAHYLQHRIPLLWEFHKVHHSAEVLTPMTVYRMHPVDDILTATCASLSVGLLEGVTLYFYPAGVPEMKLYQINIVTFAFYFIGYNLRHSHIWLNYGPMLSRFFISPAQHQIHHSKHRRHWDKNMGFIFAIWDVAFGTLYVPQDSEESEVEFGLGNGEEKEFRSVKQCYLYPFKKAGEIIRRENKPTKRRKKQVTKV